MVKRAIIFMLVLALCVSICACGETPEADNDSKETTSETTDPSTDPSDATDPTDPADPSNPADPSDPDDPTNPGNSADPNDPTNPGNSADPNDPTNPGNSANPTDFQNAEEAASSFLIAFHRNDAETLMKQTTTFENDAILRYMNIDVPAGADKDALLLNAWKSMMLGQYAPDRQMEVTTTVSAGDDAEKTIAEAKNQFLTNNYATEDDLAEIEEIVFVTCAGASSGKVILSAKVLCMKIGGCWYTSYIGTSIWTGSDAPPSVG